jgi:hypothetical protein
MNKRLCALSRPLSNLPLAVLALLLTAFVGGIGPSRLHAQATQTSFTAPEDAMRAVIKAAKDKDAAAMNRIFGPDSRALLSGDPVEDNKDFDDFTGAVQQASRLQKDSDAKYTLVVGKTNYPFPIPIVRQGTQWVFDTKAGTEEILNRRIGENELAAIATARAYVVAQWEYFTQGDWDNDGVSEYAKRFTSSPGRHNGLYWLTSEGDKPSPLGALVAAAQAEGYGPLSNGKTDESTPPRAPYHGYYFKILTGQGASAPGGKYNYIINGNMIAGHALVAYPDQWGKSGVMTFIVNQQGRVYERNLGANTAKIVSEMKLYDPGNGWVLAPK